MAVGAANLAQVMGGEPAPGTEVPLEHLDYGYISSCKSGKELEKILKSLRSGKEGRWPDLEAHCEERLATIHPKSKLLRFSTKLIAPGALDEETRKNVDQDITDWLNNMQEKDGSLKNSKNLTSADLPGVRTFGSVGSSKESTSASKKNDNAERIGGYNYKAWDRYDPEQECDKIDQESKPKPSKPKPKPAPTTMNNQVLSDPVSKDLAAEREKNKGNEAFKAGDFEESINYYSNSIVINPIAATYNNRGLAKIRLERYAKALDDFNEVLKQEPDNVKALLRRADAREKIGEIKEALEDLRRSVIVDENNKRAKQLLEEFNERHKKFLTKGGKRMKIVESSSEDEEVAVPQPGSPSPQPCTRAVTSSPPPVTSSPPPVTSSPPPDTQMEDVQVEQKPARQIINILPLPEQVAKLKAEASFMFGNGNYGDAVVKYTECIDQIDKDNQDYWYHYSVLLSNRAACKLKIGRCPDCIRDCNESLEINPRFFKSILRRAIAYENIENYRRSYEDYRLVIVLDPSQVSAQQGISRTGEMLRREYGASWRSKVSDHASVPEGPEFVDLTKQPAQQSPAPQPVQQKEVKKEEPPKSPVVEQTPKKESKPVPKKEAKQVPKKDSKPAPKKESKPVPKKEAKQVPHEPKASEKKEEKVKPKEEPKPVTKESVPSAGEKKSHMPTREEQYNKFKDQGNGHVAKQKYREALKCYDKCVTLNRDLLPAHLNSALCHLKLGDYQKCIECSDKVLSKEPANVKALYRRAAANKESKRYQAAARDLKFIIEKEPGNKAAGALLEQVKKLWNAELRGMQQNTTKSAAPQNKGRKIVIQSDSEHSESEEEIKEPLRKEPVMKKEPVKKPVIKEEPLKHQDNKSEVKSKPWLKKPSMANTAAEPPTAFSFIQHWTSYKKKKDITAFAKVLESCDPQSFPKLFHSSMVDADMVIAIVQTVDKYFIPNNKHSFAAEILQNLTKAPRFDVMTLLMNQKDKTMISSVINTLEAEPAVKKSLLSKFI